MLDTGPTPRVSKQQTADVQFAIGRTHEEAERLDQAEAAFRSALAGSPKRADIEDRLAIVLDRQGKTKEADEHFTRAIKLNPKNADLLCDRGYSYYLRNRYADAEGAFRGALAVEPKHPRSHTNLGLVLAARGEPDSAMAEFHRAGTDPADSRSNLALALALGGRIEDARDQYALALASKPGSPSATQGLRVASSVLKANANPPSKTKPTGLPGLPGEPSPALVASAPTSSPSARVDPAVVPTSMPR